MVTQIQLGNFFSSGGKTVLGGAGGSGLDTESLLNALTAGKQLPATKLQDKIDLNGKKATALTEFQTLLSAFKDATNALRNPPGVGNAASNAFKFTTTSVTSNTSVAASSYISISSSPGASLQSYTITDISSIAAAKSQITGNFLIADADTAAVSNTPGVGIFDVGTFTLNGEDITLNDGDSLNEVAEKFNAVSDDTGITATVIKVEDGKFRISFVATETGTANDFDFNGASLVDPDGVFTQLTITNTQTAADAVFKLNNVTITRSSNAISDVVSGITFNLLQTTPALTTLTATVSADTATAQNSIINFANAYNDIRVFFAQQTKLNSDGTVSEDAVLAGNQTFRSIVNDISQRVATTVAGLTGSFKSVADIGISFVEVPETVDNPKVINAINIDDGALASALATNFSSVAKIFGFNLTSSNPNLKVFSDTNALNTTSFELTVNPFYTQSTETFAVIDADTAIAATVPTGNQLGVGDILINGATISIADGDTINQVVQKFNNETATTKMTAAVTGSAGLFRIVFTSAPDPGDSINYDLRADALDPDDVFGNITFSTASSYTATYDLGAGDVTVDLTATSISDEALTLTGQSGTALEGLVLLYGSKFSSVTDVTVTQGVADQLYNISKVSVQEETGLIAVEKDALQTSDEQLLIEIAKINAQVELFRAQLLAKFTALEQVISSVNTLLQSLDAGDKFAQANS